ncbi:MAG: GNAT family N-acetyltransferase [Acidimicrobiales bacterium]
MKATLRRPSDLGPDEVAAWHRFQAEELALQNPFVSPEFASAVDGVRTDARVVVVEEDREVVGFLPCSVGGLGLARPIAPGFCDLQAFVHRPGLSWSPRAVLGAAGLRAWRFDHLLGAQVGEVTGPARPVTTAASWIIDLADGWDGYARWAKAERGRYFKWLERKQRRFQREHPDASFTYARDDPAGLSALMALKSAQCRRMGWKDLFGLGWVRDLVERLAGSRTAALAGGLSALRIGDRVVAADFSLRSSRVYAGWLIAYDPDLAPYSPGAVRWRHLLEAAAAQGVSRIDLGKGEDDFKRRFSSGTVALAVGMWTAGGPLAGAWGGVDHLGRVARSRYPTVEQRARATLQAARRRYERSTPSG